MGVHPYRTREALYREMVEGVVEERSASSVASMARGVEWESKALEVYRTLRLDGATVEAGGGHMVYCDVVPWVRGFVDAFVYDEQGVLEGIVEVKTRAPLNANTIPVPYQRIEDMYYHIPQCLVYMESTHARYCDLVSFTARGSTVFRLRFDAQLFARCVALLRVFRDCVKRGQPPRDDDGWQAERDAVRQCLLNYPWEPAEHYM